MSSPDIWDLMCNLNLKIKHIDTQQVIPFVPEPIYEQMFREIFGGGHSRWIILKARRMFMSTHISIGSLIYAATCPGATNYFINWSKGAGVEFFRDNMKTLFTENMGDKPGDCNIFRQGEWVKEKIIFNRGRSESVVANAQSVRSLSGTLIHVSDYAKMALDTPETAREIFTGSVEAMPKGKIIVESTAASPHGGFSDKVMESLERDRMGIPAVRDDFKCAFFPWYFRRMNNLDKKDIPIMMAQMKDDAEFLEYFYKVAHKFPQVPEERWAWYYMKWSRSFGRSWANLWQEHPTTPEEALHGDRNAMFLTETMRSLDEKKMIGHFPADTGDTYVSFDFGSSQSVYTAMVFWQIISDQDEEGGIRLKIIDFYKAKRMDLEHYNHIIHSKGYNVVKLLLPHDATHENSKNASNLTGLENTSIQEKLRTFGWHNDWVAPKIASKMSGYDTSIWCLHRTCLNNEASSIGGPKGLVEILKGMKRDIDSNLNVKPDIVRDALGSRDVYDAVETGARYFREAHASERPSANVSAYLQKRFSQISGRR